MINTIIFDWGSTLGLRGLRKELSSNKSITKKLKAIDSQTFVILHYLKSKNYKLGL